jgi:hypothetical protein
MVLISNFIHHQHTLYDFTLLCLNTRPILDVPCALEKETYILLVLTEWTIGVCEV